PFTTARGFAGVRLGAISLGSPRELQGFRHPLLLHDGYSSCERLAAEKARQSILPLPSGKKNGPVCHNTTSCRNRDVRGKGASQVSEARQGEAPVKRQTQNGRRIR